MAASSVKWLETEVTTVTKRSGADWSCNCTNQHNVVAANITTNRRLSSTHQRHRGIQRDTDVVHGRNELDSHADTIVLGRNSVIIHYTGRECDVAPYSDSYEPMRNVPIVTGATAVTNTETGDTIILVFNEALWMGDQLDHSLLNIRRSALFTILFNVYSKP